MCNPATFLWLSQARTWISNVLCRFLNFINLVDPVKFMFELIRNTQKKQEAQRCQAWCYLFLYLECLFLTNLDEVFFRMLLIYVSLFIKDKNFMVLIVSNIRCQNGAIPQNLDFFLFHVRFWSPFLFRVLMKIFWLRFSNIFDLAHIVFNIKGVKGDTRGQHPKW